jgi:hypothetical protein
MLRFEVITAVTMKIDVFWDVAPRGSWKNWRFGGTYRPHHQGDKNRRARKNVTKLAAEARCEERILILVTANVPGSLILSTLMMEVICFSVMSVLTRATQRQGTPLPVTTVIQRLKASSTSESYPGAFVCGKVFVRDVMSIALSCPAV